MLLAVMEAERYAEILNLLSTHVYIPHSIYRKYICIYIYWYVGVCMYIESTGMKVNDVNNSEIEKIIGFENN